MPTIRKSVQQLVDYDKFERLPFIVTASINLIMYLIDATSTVILQVDNHV